MKSITDIFRDERINQLKYELDNTIQLKNKELDALNQKMLLVMDEKDFQIKVRISFLYRLVHGVYMKLWVHFLLSIGEVFLHVISLAEKKLK